MKINTINITNDYSLRNKTLVRTVKLPTHAFADNNVIGIPSVYHRNMFEVNQNVSKIAFGGISAGLKMERLKGSLTKICEEAIDHYNKHEVSVSQNLFTRCFIHHSFGFAPKQGDDFHNIKDPFFHETWRSYINTKNRTTTTGSSFSQVYSEKMQNGIEGWIQKFIGIISEEKTSGKNNLLDELLNTGDNLSKVKQRLGIKQ